ncbi:MAG: hypothetical protein B6I24_10480 [Bacteroidetes bacterium 4572_128]|nr:MAG: hypothetical protein B6I24_10480 [Bacteroidetes bacterium 4572_128]
MEKLRKNKLRVLIFGIIAFAINLNSNAQNLSSSINENTVEFIEIPSDGVDIATFALGKTEVTNQQYVEFLNSAMGDGLITVVDESPTVMMIYDNEGNQLINILGSRVVKDHDNNGVYQLWEMENPLNRCMIDYNIGTNLFSVIDPNEVEWEIYFDNTIYPNVVDHITDWCEFHDFWSEGNVLNLDITDIVIFLKTEVYVGGDLANGEVRTDITFAGQLDMDCELPTLEEVKHWPVNHIRYYGAKAFADYYEYLLPSIEELRWSGKGGYPNRQFATDDGIISDENTVYNGGYDKSDGKHKGHAQVVAYFNSKPNPYGVYDLGGNVTEWTRTANNDPAYNARDMSGGNPAMIKIDGAWPRPDEFCEITSCTYTNLNRGNDHFGFRVSKIIPSTRIYNTVDNKTLINIFPNPTTSDIYINLGKKEKDLKIILSNNLGQIVLIKEFKEVNILSLNIDRPAGVYFLKIAVNGKESKTMKILKK